MRVDECWIEYGSKSRLESFGTIEGREEVSWKKWKSQRGEVEAENVTVELEN